MPVVVEFSTIPEMFERIATKYAKELRPMFMRKIDNAISGISFTQYRRDVKLFSPGLASLGATKNDRVAIISENRPEWVVADMGIVTLGAVDVPVSPTLTPPQIAYIVNDSETKIVVFNALQLNKVMKISTEVKSLERIILINENMDQRGATTLTMTEVLALGERFEKSDRMFFHDVFSKVGADDLHPIVYTSGTTGNPKGVMLTHRTLASNIKAAATVFPLGPDDTLLLFLPLCHSFERMAGYYTAMAWGSTVAYAESEEEGR